MGEVYRARDTRLGRDVAIKVLPQPLAQDASLRQRFDREAKALSSLNHPHICTLHDVGQQDGIEYLVMELVEGETLLDRLKRGPLAVEQVLKIAIELADALDKAHRSGLIHRDLKPGNVMLTKAGAKLMDFGLAKQGLASGLTGSTALPTQEKPLTDAGSLLGTYEYMSPEQLEGREADARSDIWALGCTVYEMAVGRRAFDGKSRATLISAIMTSEPEPITHVQKAAPSALDHLVKTCLAKDPEDRWQSARDLAGELRWAAGTTRAQTGAARSSLAGRLVWPLAVLAAAAAGWIVRSWPREGSALHVTEAMRLTHEAGTFESPSWSPDGKLVAFASNRSGNFEVYVRRVDGGQEVNVTDNPSEDFQPALSPDGRSVAFVSTRSSQTGVIPIGTETGMEVRRFGGDLWITPALGGNARRLAPNANYPTWRPDGSAILYVTGSENRRSLREVSPDGSGGHEVLASALEITRPHYSPDARWITFEGQTGTIYLMAAKSGAPRPLFPGMGQAWASDGTLFFLRRGNAGGTTIGRVEIGSGGLPIPGSEKIVAVLTGTMRDIAVGPGGHAIALAEFDGGFNLARLPLSQDGSRPSGPEEALSAGPVRDRYPVFSFAGGKVAYSSNRAGPDEVWVLDLKTLRRERLPAPQDDLGTYVPCWLPSDDGLIVKRFRVGGPASVWRLSLDGSSVEELVQPGGAFPFGTMAVSPDGRELLLMRQEDGGRLQLYALDLASKVQRRVPTSEGNQYDPFWSRDGREIGYFASAEGALQLWTQPAGGGGARQLTFGNERFRHGSFSADGKWIYVQQSHRNVWRVPTAGGTLEQVTTWPESGLFIEEPSVSPDGRSLVYARWNGGASLWLLTVDSSSGAAASPP
jgi:serine/threonine protein kinase/sugar lactone lactonase YvrE